MKGQLAIVVWVKTVGLSPLKTRLAATIGKEKAETFYRYSYSAIESTLKNLSSDHSEFSPIWAVAEKEGLGSPEWRGFEKFLQPIGSLGERLEQAYRSLINQYDAVIFIGADTPNISVSDFLLAKDHLSDSSFVLGESTDGGYWLFAGRRPLPKNAWLNVRYSHESTARDFKRELSPYGEVTLLDLKTDVDTLDDLMGLASKKLSLIKDFPQLAPMLEWVETL